MRLHTTYPQFCPSNTGTLLCTDPGGLHALIFTCLNTTAMAVTIYDNAAGSGNILIKLNLKQRDPISIFFPPNLTLQFSTGMYVQIGANIDGFVILAYYYVILNEMKACPGQQARDLLP